MIFKKRGRGIVRSTKETQSYKWKLHLKIIGRITNPLVNPPEINVKSWIKAQCSSQTMERRLPKNVFPGLLAAVKSDASHLHHKHLKPIGRGGERSCRASASHSGCYKSDLKFNKKARLKFFLIPLRKEETLVQERKANTQVQ